MGVISWEVQRSVEGFNLKVPPHACMAAREASKGLQEATKASKGKEVENLRSILSLPNIVAIYLGYSILLFFGLFRQWVGKVLIFLGLKSPEFVVRKGYAPLFKEVEYFWLFQIYQKGICYINYHLEGSDCWERPISSVPGTWIDVMDRYSTNQNKTYEYTGTSTKCLNLGSYNYLGFAETKGPIIDNVAESIRSFGVSSASPRMEGGNSTIVKELEALVCEFVGKEAAMVFGMGFATNSTTIPLLCGKDSLIISDSFNHNSIVTGARDSGAKIRVFQHNNPSNLEKILKDSIVEGQPRTHRPWKKIVIIVEGIYSMEGEICRLEEIVAIKKKYKAYLYVDEAHSIGALGPSGRGICEHWQIDPKDIDVLMGTFTKAFGSVGGYVASSKEMIRFLRSSSYASLYSSMSPPCATQALLALRSIMGLKAPLRSLPIANRYLEDGRDRVRKLHWNANYFRAQLLRLGFHVFGEKDSPVAAMMLFHPGKIPALSRLLLARGIAVVVVGFPVVPLALARARFCISAGHTKEDLDFAIHHISEMGDLLFLKYKKDSVTEEEWKACL